MTIAILATGTRGGLAYFSADSLEVEAQGEFRVLTGLIPIWRTSRERLENPVAAYLRNTGFVELRPASSDRWYVLFHWNRAWYDGYSPLGEVFTKRRESVLAWSQADPERARIYWSTGIGLLRSNQKRENWAGEIILNQCSRAESIQQLNDQIAAIKREYGI